MNFILNSNNNELIGVTEYSEIPDEYYINRTNTDKYKLVSEEELFKGCSSEEEKIYKLFVYDKSYYSSYKNLDGTYSVEIIWGDWKHDHLHCDYLMKALGYKLSSENVIEEDGSDTYSSIHIYTKVA